MMKQVWDLVVGILAVAGLVSLPMIWLTLRSLRSILRDFVIQHGKMVQSVAMVAKHGIASGTELDANIKMVLEAVAHIPKQTVIEQQKIREKEQAIVPVPPPPIPAPVSQTPPHGIPVPKIPDKTDPRGPSSGTVARMMVASILCFGATASAIAPREGKGMDAAECLRNNDLDGGEKAAVKAGDYFRLSEVKIRQGKLDEAEIAARRLSARDPNRSYLLALIARGKGDVVETKALMEKAKKLGSKEARDFLAAGLA